MARRARRADRGRSPAAPSAPGKLNAPFSDLARRFRVAAPVRRPVPPSVSPAAVDDFARAMDGVVRLRDARTRVDGPAPAGEARPPVSEDAEALALLSDLVDGNTRFDISDTREYVEGAIVGLDPRLVRRLRRGDFAWQAHLDLHGLTAPVARERVEQFLVAAVRAGHRCVLIVHGRGHNSKDQTPVLKERLKSWLARGLAARIVLCFTTARPCDGGAGALYVLLRRDRQRRPIRVTEGAKR
jgi:DNA-nicking Smr family endonuclease